MQAKNIILLFVAIAISVIHLRAQELLIVKDYNNCTVGLQDDAGKWVVQPVYEQIEHFDHGFARALRAGKWGLLNENGKEIVPTKYQSLIFACDRSLFNNPLRPPLYLEVIDKTHAGIIDTSGNVIVPCQYLSISCLMDSVFIAQEPDGTWTFIHLDGSIYKTSLKAEPKPFRPHLFRFTQTDYRPIPGKSRGIEEYNTGTGLVTDKGELVIPPLYETIEPSVSQYSGYEVMKDGKYGYYDVAYKVILECGHDVWQGPSVYRSTTRSYLFTNGYTAASRNNKTGIISITGDTILPFIFDSIRKPNRWLPTYPKIPFWEVCYNHQWGLVDSSGKWLIEPVLDQSTLVVALGSYGAIRSFEQYSYCAGVKNGKHGALSLNGDTLVQFQYDTSWTSGDATIFWSPEEMIRLDFNLNESSVGMPYSILHKWYGSYKKVEENILGLSRDWETDHPKYRDTLLTYNRKIWDEKMARQSPRNSKIVSTLTYPYLFVFKELPSLRVTHIEKRATQAAGYSTYIYKDPDSYESDDVVAVYDSASGQLWIPQRQIYGKHELTFGNKESGTGVLSASGNLIVPPFTYQSVFRLPEPNPHHLYQVFQFNGLTGLVDSTGATVIEPVWSQMVTHWNSDTIWLQHYIGGDPGTCLATWCAYDLFTHKMVIDSSWQLSYPFHPFDTRTSISTSTGVGLLDASTMHVLIPPVYAGIYPLDDSTKYYAVTTCSGKTGVCDINHTLIVDTAYTAIYMTECRSVVVNGRWTVIQNYVLSNSADDYMVFHWNTGVASHDSAAYREVISALVAQKNDTRFAPVFSSRQSDIKLPKIGFGSGVGSLQRWQYKWLFGLLLTARNNPNEYRTYCVGNNNACSCAGRGYGTSRYNGDIDRQQEHVIVFSSPSFMSGYTTTTYMGGRATKPAWYEYSFQYYNLVQDSSGTGNAELYSLFGDTVWRTVVIDSVLSYLTAHPGINADCSQPQNIPRLFNNSYLVVKDGINLYPNWKENTRDEKLPQRPVIFIPWTALRPHLKPETEAKIFSD